MDTDTDRPTVQWHWRRSALFDTIVRALEQSGKNVENVSVDDLGPSTNFIHGGRPRRSSIDLTLEFVAVAQALTRLTHLDGKGNYRQGDALPYPFVPATFDVVWCRTLR